MCQFAWAPHISAPLRWVASPAPEKLCLPRTECVLQRQETLPLRVFLLLTPVQRERLPSCDVGLWISTLLTIALKLFKASFLQAWGNVRILYLPPLQSNYSPDPIRPGNLWSPRDQKSHFK